MGGNSESRIQNPEDAATATANDTFRIDRLTLKNFRCFDEKTIDFHPRFNVLIGDNGSGKTAVLEALAAGAAPVPRAFDIDSEWEPDITSGDVRRLTFPTGNVEHQYPASCRWAFVADRYAGAWEAEVDTKGAHSTNWGQLQGALLPLKNRAWEGAAEALPLVAHYAAERQWVHSKPGRTDLFEPGSRARGYEHCLRPTLGPERFVLWFKTMALDSFQQGAQLPALQAVANAVQGCVPRCEQVRFDARQSEVVVTVAEGQRFPFAMLSHGVRGVLGMVADIAWRSVLLNPHFAADAPRLTPGVVLIDEIDLHLHPKWQRHVVDDLKRAFPKVQFIVTTHSPFIIQSLEPGELISLDAKAGQERVGPQAYYRKSIEDIAEDPMGVPVPSRSAKFQEMVHTAEEYFGLLRDGEAADPSERDTVKRRLDELMARFSDDPAWVALLKAEREAAGQGVVGP